MDLSDGLADAVTQLSEASGTGARLDATALPLPDVARQWFSAHGLDPIRAAAGGDDYELLFTVSPQAGTPPHGRTPVAGPRHHTDRRVDPPVTSSWHGRAVEPLPEGFTHFEATCRW